MDIKLRKDVEDYKAATNNLIAFLSDHANRVMKTMKDLNITELKIDDKNTIYSHTWRHEYGCDYTLNFYADTDSSYDLTINSGVKDLGRNEYLGGNFNCGYVYPRECDFLRFARLLREIYAKLDQLIEEKTEHAKNSLESLKETLA